MLGREGCQSIEGGGLGMGQLSFNDGRQMAIQHFTENERNFYMLTLDDSRYIHILIYPHIWGIVGRVTEVAFLVLISEFANNSYLNLTIYRKYSKVADFNCL